MRPNIRNWQQFARLVRSRPEPMLARLSDFDNPLLVTGCQRSGTTMLTSILTKQGKLVDYQQTDDGDPNCFE